MAKQQGGRRVSGRTLTRVAGAAAIFVVGALVGGGCTADAGVQKQRQQIEQCLPITAPAQLDSCLGVTP